MPRRSEYNKQYYQKNKDQLKAASRKYYADNKAERRDQVHIKQYGISRAERVELFEHQGSCCAICNSASPNNSGTDWQLDHDHASGAVRGVLCHHCNQMLAGARDNPATLSAAIDYLRNHNVRANSG